MLLLDQFGAVSDAFSVVAVCVPVPRTPDELRALLYDLARLADVLDLTDGDVLALELELESVVAIRRVLWTRIDG